MLRFALLACMALAVSAGWFDWNRVEKQLHKFNFFGWGSPKKHVIEMFKKNNNVCHTQECFQIAADYWQGMNKSVDPCEDFYEYVCGNWAGANPIPPTELVWHSMAKMRKKVSERIRDLLEEPIKQNDILPVKQTKKFYKSCMDLEALERRGIKPIEAFLVRNGGWPMIMEPGEWNSEQSSWREIDEYYSELTFSPALFYIGISPPHGETNSSTDDFERKDGAIRLSPPIVPSDVITWRSGKIFNVTDMFQDGTYAKYIKEIAVIFAKESGANINLEEIEKDVKDIIEFELKLLNIRETINITEGESYISMEELQNIYDLYTSDLTENFRIDWKKILFKLFGDVNFELDGQKIVLIRPSNYIEVWVDLMNNTDPRIIVNYIHWNFVNAHLSLTTSKMEELRYELLKDRPGVKEAKPRWEKCTSAATSMNHAVAYQFINKYFKDKMKEEAEEIFSRIQKEMVKHILKSDWISDDMRKLELEKIQKMKMNVGYPDWYHNITALTSIYRGLVINNQYLDNVLSLRRFFIKKFLKSLKTPHNNEDDWLSDPLIVNAFYHMEKNSFTIPAADFQLPIYSLTQPKTINYGEFGLVISHEVAHGFDNYGMLYDETGKMYEYKWFDEMNESFYNRTMCFVEQHKNFDSDSETISDNFTERIRKASLREDIADSLGLEIIFGTLEEKEKESRSLKLPGFEDWNNEQLFFLSYGKLWCRNAVPEFEEEVKKYDSHSTPKYRANVPLQNSEEFAKVFKCPKGSPMNPEIKCKIW